MDDVIAGPVLASAFYFGSLWNTQSPSISKFYLLLTVLIIVFTLEYSHPYAYIIGFVISSLLWELVKWERRT